MFTKAEVKRWRKVVHKELYRLGFNSRHEEGLVLAAVSEFGTDLSILEEITGVTQPTVRDVLKRLRKSRVLKGQVLSVDWTTDVGFCLDVMTSINEVQRVIDEKMSAAQKQARRSVEAKPRRKRVVVAPGTMFTPKKQMNNSRYSLT